MSRVQTADRREQLDSATAASLYVHVPFCVVKCGYCDFNSFADADSTNHDRFLGSLERTLQSEIRDRPQPPSVFIGGGTPTYLDETRFARLLEILRSVVDLDHVSEVTIEANPESVNAAKARLAREAGIRRVSIGAQSFDAERLRFLDRAHDADAIRRAVDIFRAAEFDNISLDLIYSLPGQTPSQWREDLDRALVLEPDHLSCYSLTFEAGTRLNHARKQGLVTPNDDSVDRVMFDDTRSILEQAGFVAYEVSNFAGRGGPCRHNDHYWLQGNYLGIGPGASSHRDGVRWTDLKPVDAWCGAIERGLPPVAEAETLDQRQRAAEALWLGIRRRDGVSLARVADRVGVDPRRVFAEELRALQSEGMVEFAAERLRLTPAGLPFSDVVGARLLGG